jgi:arginyl-tRNA synthetase
VSLIDDIKNIVLEKMKDREMEEDEKETVSEDVAIGALRYSILRQTAGKDIVFDAEKSVSFEGDSGPYLQYATVRANSILKKAEGAMSAGGTEAIAERAEKVPENWETTNLERFLERFPNIVERAGNEYAPHYIATYLIELAGEFNSFYADHKIIDEADPSSPYRLALTRAFVYVMTSGLNLLGIKVPEKM